MRVQSGERRELSAERGVRDVRCAPFAERPTAHPPIRPSALLRALACATLLCANPQPASAQELDLSGYLENTAQLDYTDAVGAELLNAGKLRVDLRSYFGAGFSLTGNLNAIGAVGATRRHLTPYLPPAVGAALVAAGVPDTFSIEELRIFVDNLFLAWDGGSLRVRVGRQQLAWGPGYSFNPTDLFHRKTLVDPTYEKEGVSAVRADYVWGIGGRLSVIAKPRESLSKHLAFRGPAGQAASVAGVGLRAATHLEALGTDVAVTLHQVTDSTGLDPTTLTAVGQRRRAIGLELTSTLLGLGVWLEGNMSFMEREDDFVRVVVGADYTLRNGIYLTAETFYNGRPSAQRPYPIRDWLANLAHGEPVGPGWVLAGAQRELSPLVSGGAFVFATPGGSVLLNPRLDISVTQNLDAVLYGGVTFGAEEGAFPPGLFTFVARGTYYFQL